MAVNKVVYGDETLLDLTNDSVTPDTLAEGATAHDASGARITGTMKSGGGGDSVQSDWNQTDETAADFIKNKPFGDVTTVILEEQELVFDAEMGGCIGAALAPIQDGDTVTVTFDGDTYICTAMFHTGVGGLIFGNQMLLGGNVDSGEPFMGAYAEGMVMLLPADEAGHAVGIVSISGKAIPEKYIVLPKFYIHSDGYIYTDVMCSVKATANDIPNTTNFEIGIVTMGVVAYWLTPISISSKILGMSLGYREVEYVLGNSKKAYTAEYTPTT